MANKNITKIKDLKGKRIGVSQIGDAPYNYTQGLLKKAGLDKRDVQPGADRRRCKLAHWQLCWATASMPPPVTAPKVYFKIEAQGYSNLGNISDYDDIYAPSVYLFKKSLVAANPKLPELLIKAHAEAIKRFYDDKAFAIKAYLAWDKQDPDDISRVYDHYAKVNTYERVPYVLARDGRSLCLDRPADEQDGSADAGLRFSKGDRQQHGGTVSERRILQAAIPVLSIRVERKRKRRRRHFDERRDGRD